MDKEELIEELLGRTLKGEVSTSIVRFMAGALAIVVEMQSAKTFRTITNDLTKTLVNADVRGMFLEGNEKQLEKFAGSIGLFARTILADQHTYSKERASKLEEVMTKLRVQVEESVKE
jgi:hypothetical protein